MQPIYEIHDEPQVMSLEVARIGRETITIERSYQKDGITRWAIRCNSGQCLAKDGGWDLEPMPSNRTDEWLEDHRWNDLEAAKVAAKKAATETIQHRLEAAKAAPDDA